MSTVNRAEARIILLEQIGELRGLSYSELLEFQTPYPKELETSSGTKYQLEVESFWDNEAKKTLRVCVSIDDGGWRSFVPMSEDFIVAPDGTFVGE